MTKLDELIGLSNCFFERNITRTTWTNAVRCAQLISVLFFLSTILFLILSIKTWLGYLHRGRIKHIIMCANLRQYVVLGTHNLTHSNGDLQDYLTLLVLWGWSGDINWNNSYLHILNKVLLALPAHTWCVSWSRGDVHPSGACLIISTCCAFPILGFWSAPVCAAPSGWSEVKWRSAASKGSDAVCIALYTRDEDAASRIWESL